VARRESRKISLATLLSRIEASKVDEVFDVAYVLYPNRPQHVVLLRDGSYLCTCLLLQNSGIVCRHFFRLMMVDRRCKYHVSLVHRRWYKEVVQDDRDIDPSQELFVFAENQKLNLDDNDRGPRPESYMQDVLAAFSSQSAVPRPDAALISSKRRYGELTGLSKQIAQRVSGDPREFERVKAVLAKELAELMEDEEIQNPAHVKGKGRPRKKRFRSAAEGKERQRQQRCGNCGEEGHNARRCRS
jgi:hypothetical protein